MSNALPPSDDDERCPLCPAAGPPTFASVRGDQTAKVADGDAAGESIGETTSGIDDSANLVWIACSRCETWYHSCCLLLAGDEVRETIPQAVRDEVETNHKDEAPFFDWTVWINRWCEP